MMYDGIFYEILDQLGTMPLPPYIKENLKIKIDIKQFTLKLKEVQQLLQLVYILLKKSIKNKDKGIEILDVCLHVGLGTFRPVKEENVLDHHMHSEFI